MRTLLPIAFVLLGPAALAADRTQGLAEMAARQGWRLMEHVRRGETFLSERTVLRDARTGSITWRMTSDPAVDANDYYDLPSWNADGSLMAFLTTRGGRKQMWLMDPDGKNLRPLRVAGGQPVERGYWSGRYRDRLYQAIEDEKGTVVSAINPFTGERRTIVRVDRRLGDMQPPHPSENWFLFGTREGEPDAPSKAYIVGLNGSVEEVAFERRWHRLRFTKSSDRRLFFNYDEPRTQWTILPDGSGRTSIPYTGGHPDWLPDGSELFYFAPDDTTKKPHVWGVRYDGTRRRVIAPFGGHGGPSLDGDWFVADAGVIAAFRTDGSQTSRILFYPNSSNYSHTDTQWHPDHHTTHPHACFSPDGTKIIFNSDFLGQYTDVYVSVNRFPDPPRELVVKNGGAALAWRAPQRGREIRGYHVYRTAQSGIKYQRVTTDPVSGTTWRVPAAGHYVVTAVEHSGLESRPSREVFTGGEWKGPARLIAEAEAGAARLPMEEALDQQGASNGLYVASRGGQAGGMVTVEVDAPKKAAYRLWARVKGSGSISAGEWGGIDCAGAQWTWRQAGKAVTLDAGTAAIRFTPGTGGEAIDKVLLTDDAAFVPAGPLVLDEQAPPAPAQVRISPVSPNALRLAWRKAAASDLDHYNVYSGVKPDFACDRAALLSSPSEAEHVDWGLPLNSARWYRITAVDRAGNESAPSAAVRGNTPKFEPLRIALKPAEARLENASLETAAAAGGPVLRPASERNASGTWSFVAPRDGEYAIWVRSNYDKGKPSAFELTIDGQPRIAWRAWGRWGQWLWSPAGNQVSGTPQIFRLAAGKHTLRAVAKSRTANAAEIVVTDDPSWWPVTGMRTERRTAGQSGAAKK